MAVLCYYKLVTIEQDVMDRTLIRLKVDIDENLKNIEIRMNAFFTRAELSIGRIASELNRDKPDFNRIIPGMMSVLKENQCTAIGTHFSDTYDKKTLKQYFSEYTYKDETKTLYSPFFTKNGRTEKTYPYDYTDTGPDSKNSGWYSEKIKEGSWFGPYFGAANKKFLISYRIPFRWSENTQSNLGNVVADYSLENLRDIMADIQLLNSGYGIIITDSGMIISHPVKEYLARNISEIDDLHLTMEMLNKLEKEHFHELEHIDGYPKNSKNSRERLIYSRDFSVRGWTILVVLNKNETLIYEAEDRNNKEQAFEAVLHKIKVKLILLITVSIFILCLLFLINRKNRDWYIVSSFSILCIFAVLMIWYNHLLSERSSNNNNIVVSNKTDLEAALNSLNRVGATTNVSNEQLLHSQIKIKTGFFIQSVKFSSANDIFVTGYAWQKTPPLWQNKIAVGDDSSTLLDLVLPEAESATVTVVYSDREITRWYFEASLRQSFNYLKYPFDDEEIWIRTRFRDFYQDNVILVPDFDSYPNFEPVSYNGLESDIFIEGWSIIKTFYYFKNINYTSNFGMFSKKKILTNKPDLYFNISIRRDFLGVFVAYMIPLTVVAFLLFAVLMIRTRNSAKNELFGFNAAMVLGYAASLFFVLIVSHMSLRETLHAKGIIYLEYFFFCLYLAIAFVAANSITFSYKQLNAGMNDKWITLLYWPSLVFSILIITIMRFS